MVNRSNTSKKGLKLIRIGMRVKWILERRDLALRVILIQMMKIHITYVKDKLNLLRNKIKLLNRLLTIK